MKLYCLSGLGADKRFFINLENEGLTFEHMEWIEPKKNESLKQYARRMYEEHITEDQFNLIGLSFGGMVAQEIAKIKEPNQLILLSTIEGRHQLPWYFKAMGTLRTHKLLTDGMLTSNNWLSRFLFGVHSPEIGLLFNEILQESDPEYLRWAMNSILEWRNDHELRSITIHGSKDRLLPIRKNIDFRIEMGGHLMLIDHAETIGKIIKKAAEE